MPMALNLLKAGMTVTVYDVVSKAMEEAVKAGAKGASTLSEACAKQDVIITMVQTGKQVNELCRADDGIFKNMDKAGLYIDCSSIDISTSRELHQAAEKLGIAMLDSPVSGGVAGATSGSLTMMVGGSAADFKRAEPVLKIMGKKIIHAGQSGSGQAAKICNNMLLAISMIGVSEAFNLANKLGLDQKKFFEISSNASGQCWSMTSYCPVPNIIENVPANHHYQPGFMAKMMLKDLRLAMQAANSVDAAIPLGGMATELYELFVKHGYGEMDFSGIIKLVAEEQE